MYRFSGVTIDGDDSASSRAWSTFAVMPSTQRSASSRELLASSVIDSSRLRAITGSITFSSKLPPAPATVIVVSVPITWAATISVASQITGFTLPGMMLEPGWRSGSAISPRPARGPDPIQRRSLQIFVTLTAIVFSCPDSSTRPSRAPCASKWSSASLSSRPVRRLSSAITAAAKPGGVLIPVPTAVPPRGSSATRGRVARTRSAPRRICWAYPLNSWPSVTGVASIRCVRPDFTTWANSDPLRDRESARCSRAGNSSCTTPAVAATWIADGKMSLLDCDALTWSFGCTSSPSAWVARVARTSLTFMFVEVPDPVWNTSIGNSASCSPAATSPAADTIAADRSASRTPSEAFTIAADALICASACTNSGASGRPEIGKFSTARCVCARHRAFRGTLTSPIVSCSILNSTSSPIPAEYRRPPLSEGPDRQPVDNTTGGQMKFTQPFQISRWDQAPYDETGTIQLGRATVGKTFSGTDLEGTSSAELLMVGTADGPAAYTAVERFTGTLGGRKGSFVMLHGATADQTSSPGRIVAAEGDLAGLTGTVVYEHDEQGARITVDYELP